MALLLFLIQTSHSTVHIVCHLLACVFFFPVNSFGHCLQRVQIHNFDGTFVRRDVACYCSFFIECLWRAIDRFSVCFSFLFHIFALLSFYFSFRSRVQSFVFLYFMFFFLSFLFCFFSGCENVCVAGSMRILFYLHYTIFFIFYVALLFHSWWLSFFLLLLHLFYCSHSHSPPFLWR